MRTAYAIHTVEGVPVRRTVETQYDPEIGLLSVVTKECNWEWEPKGKSVETVHKVSPKVSLIRRLFASPTPEKDYHQRFRKQMKDELHWRFELYLPLSSLDV